MLRLLLALLLTLAGAPTAHAVCSEGTDAVTWSCHQITFESSIEYDHPVGDVEMVVTFRQPGQEPISVHTFWDGGRTYRARVALPSEGVWTYDVAVSDRANALDGRRGEVSVTLYAGDDPFLSKGWLRSSGDERYLTYDDGTPFFWLGDTAWEISARSYPDQVSPYLQDRRTKGFNALQIVANTHLEFFRYHVRNRLGHEYLLMEDRSRPNPSYFEHLDRIVSEANEAGMVVAIVPLWGAFAAPHRDKSPHSLSYSAAEAVSQAAYVGARYAGHNVVWIVGGDMAYDTDEKRSYWDAFARTLRSASGGRHLMTAHPGGYSGSFDSWPIPPDWLDFHMYQASHFADLRYLTEGNGQRVEDAYGALRAEGGYSWEGGLRGYHLRETAPILNAEANYEDIPSRFWEDSPDPPRVQAADVRHVAYWGLLSGSTVGFTYGAHGVWSWSTEDPQPEGSWVRLPVGEATSFPGSSHMTRLRSFAETHRWHEWVPRPDLVDEVDSDHFVAAATWGDRTVVYCPTGTRLFRLAPPDSAATFDLAWTNAATGATASAVVERRGDAPLVLSPPDQSDWLLVVSPQASTAEPPAPPPAPLAIRLAGPNPSRDGFDVTVATATARDVRLRVVDVLGRVVYSEDLPTAGAPQTVSVRGLPSGTYVCTATAAGPTGRTDAASLTATVIR